MPTMNRPLLLVIFFSLLWLPQFVALQFTRNKPPVAKIVSHPSNTAKHPSPRGFFSRPTAAAAISVSKNGDNSRFFLLRRCITQFHQNFVRLITWVLSTLRGLPLYVRVLILTLKRRLVRRQDDQQALEIAYMKKKKFDAESARRLALIKGMTLEQNERRLQQKQLASAARKSATETFYLSQSSSSKPTGVSSELPITQNSEKRRVLILMSDTGGGHRASAEAIDRALSEQNPGKVEVEIMDIWTDHAIPPFDKFVSQYRFLAKHPLLWRIMFAYGEFTPTKLFTETWSWMACYGRFKKAIVASNPDVVISVHPLCQLMPMSIVNEMNAGRSSEKLPVSFITVVTDLGGAHSTWFDKRADFCFVPSEAVKKVALQCGVDPSRIVMHGLPVRPAFWRRQAAKSKNMYRGSLFLDPDVKTVLLMGGGDGVGGLEEIAIATAGLLGTSTKRSQVVVICGHNQQLSGRLKSRQWPSNVRVVVKGFQKNIDEFMAACDLLVTKAGPGTIAEAMVQGIPMVLSSFLPGQEAGNVPYVVDGGFGVYTGNNPRKIAQEVYNLFEDEARLEAMSVVAKQKSRAESSQLIAKDIGTVMMRKVRDLPELKSSMS